ncbi:MAG: PilC/PilY family type IV pilus protein [Archangium sp.]|nr:PilC/PilY family type IV pilus protein [Archangium sp.]MDP3573652.1 PilC/PilY family type IV pilus protein [Archangium sp.]
MRTPLRFALALATCASLTASTRALAIDNGACCVQSTSRLETQLNPNKGSDETFFSAAGGPPNVMFLLGTNDSMQEYPVQLPTGADGCTDPALTAGMSFFNLLSADPAINGIIPVDPDTNFSGSGTEFFDPTRYYVSLRKQLPIKGTHTPWSLDSSFKATQSDSSASTACGKYGFGATCVACLASTGWYKGSSDRWVLSGRVLNVQPPKFVVARKVLKDAISNVGNVRMGITIFGPNTGFYDEPTQIHPIKPNCNRAFPWDEGAGSGAGGGTLRNDLRSQINQVEFTNNERSIGEALFGIGAYFSTQTQWNTWFTNSFSVPTNYPGSSGWTDGVNMWLSGMTFESGGQQLSVCWPCQQTAVVVLTDGAPFADNSVPQSRMMQILIDAGVKHPDGTALTFAPGAGGTCPNTAPSGGVNYCDQFGGTKCGCDTGAYPQGPDNGNKNFMDDVAFFLANTDLRPDYVGKQNVRVYTIGYGDNSPMLQSIARAGDGLFFRADNATELSQAITSAVNDIQNRATSFSSAAVAAVQTGSSSTPALLPRMLPKAGEAWQGKLWRFDQYNEFVEDADLNGDSDKEDVFIVDDNGGSAPTAGNIVTEASDGAFVKGSPTPSGPAAPFWEANGRLVSNLAAGVTNRKVWTVVDSNGDGAFTSTDTITRFLPSSTEADDLKMAEYLGIRRSMYCPTSPSLLGKLFEKWNLTLSQAQTATGFTLPSTPAQKDYDRLCARALMLYVNGADMFDQDGDGNRAEVRANVLGDIFHSSPVVVGPPVDPFLCNLGLSNQCARTLFAQDMTVPATPSPNQTVTGSVCGITSLPPYEAYVFEQRRRQQVVLVGANDGMVHAFVSAALTSESCVGGQPAPVFNKGTGNEAWAFIPPDLLPKLADSVLGHEYLVDGDIMVRDIWADTSADGVKQKNEFHTLAVVSEGRGGKHYLALELQYTAGGVVLDQPGFRWMFPQPCSEEAATFGKTFLSISPKPPAIGPVLIDDPSLPAASNIASATPVVRNGVDTHERWVVALSGGWSPALEKGRGVYIVDAWDGQINGRRDNLWWKFEFDESASGLNAPAKELTHSVSAPVALVDYGSNESPQQDGFFDTALFGDTSGQLWVSRLHTPGTFDNTTKRIGNWYTGRAYEMDRDGVPGGATASLQPDGGFETPDPNAKSVSNKGPFFYLPSAAIEPGTNKLRIFAGTGNRYALLERGPGSCRFDNPLACSKARCDDVKFVSKHKDAVVDIGKMETHWKSRRFEHGKLDENVSIGPTTALTSVQMCGTNGSKRVEASNEEAKVGSCNLLSGPNPNPGEVNKVKFECGLDSTGEAFTCTQEGSSTRSLSDLLDNSLLDTSGLGSNRFVGVWAYGGTQADGGFRGWGGTSGITPQQYDARRVSDRSTSNPGSGELINVTNVGCAADQSCDGGATASDFGWFFNYSALDQKTASGGAVIASCVLWSDLAPAGGDAGVCSTTVTPLSRIYQSDFITGQPNCAFGFLPLDGGSYARSQGRTVVAPPPEPASVVQVSKTGEVRYSAMIVEPGAGQATSINVSGGQDVLQFVYEVPVSRSLHNCRHADAGCDTTP